LLAQKGILGDQLASASRQIAGSAEQQTVAVRLGAAIQPSFHLMYGMAERMDQPTPNHVKALLG
jgi:hypothetical protein